MPDTLLLETGTDRFLLEDSSGFLLMEVPLCYYDVVMADAPVSYWRLGEPSGATTAIDARAANNGTYTASPTLAVAGALTGDTNTAMTLNGTSQYVVVTDSASLDFANGGISYECWIKNPAGGGSSRYLMSKGTQAPVLLLNGSGNVRFDNLNWASLVRSTNTIPAADNIWHHLVGTKASGGLGWTVYVDGADVTLVTGVMNTTNGTTVDTATNLFIGVLDTLASWFPGSIDEVAVYNVALTYAQVQAHYNSASAGCARHFGPIVLQAMNRAATR